MSEINWQQIREEYESGSSLRQLAAKYGVSKSLIGNHKYQEKWTEPNRSNSSGQWTPPQNSRSRTPNRDVNAAVRAQSAIKLYLEERPTWDEIAARCGYASRGAAHDAVMRELDRCITKDVEALRSEELYMIRQLQSRCYREGLTQPAYWTFAVKEFVSLSERKAKLMGMDTPVGDVAAATVIVREVPAGLLEEVAP